jgi:hypothetical protein
MSFAIVHKNRVIVGPMGWNQKYFTNVLKIRHRVDANIPGIEPEVLPFIIDESTSIHRVIENKPDINLMTHHYYGPLWDLSQDVIIANYEVKDIAIEVARDNFRVVAAAERYKKEVSGAKTILQDKEVTLDTSREGRNIFVQKFLLMSEDDIVNWKFPEGWLTISKQELGSVVLAGAAHIQKSFDWEKEINNQIDACSTLQELVSLTIVEGQVE